ncbi:MAG TPA: hypothetical protein DE179_06455 [Oceanospirillaceae bacterium]|nr:hypothetical protein [Oceanospirillaceae bacterium]
MENTVLIALLSAFCLGMLSLVIVLLGRQRARVKENQRRIENLQLMLQEQYKHRVDSIRVIANAMDEGQCEFTEGCIRLKMLIDQLNPELLQREEFAIITHIYAETEHMPIKEDWKKLDKKVKNKLTNERIALEGKNHAAIAAAVKALRQYQFAEFGEVSS